MDGIHDLGGMDGFGKVDAELDEPTFHAAWEGRVMAMQRAMMYAGAWNIDMLRYAQERLPPQVYLEVSYYERWLLATEVNSVDRDCCDTDELAAGHSLRPAKPLPRKLTAAMVDAGLVRGGYARPAPRTARYAPGERVRAKNIHPATHTRLPRYARGHVGIVERVHGCHVFPDSASINLGDNPQWLYTVRFDGPELWGPDTDPTVSVSIDAFEPYLEPAPEHN